MKRMVWFVGLVLLLSAGTATANSVLSGIDWERNCLGQMAIEPILGGNKITCYDDNQDPPTVTSTPGSPAPTDTPSPDPTNGPSPTPAPDVIELPGRFEVEDYRLGGEGVGYHDTTPGNSGGAYRNDDVDIEPCTEGTDCYSVGWVQAGEWLAYDVNFDSGGTFFFRVRVATPDESRSFHIELDGVDITGSIAITPTGGWHTWGDANSKAVSIGAGRHELKIVADTNRFNLNYVEVLRGDNPAPTSVPTDVPGNPSGWHPPTDHEHGDRPPAWVLNSALQPKFDGPEAHQGFKAMHADLTAENGEPVKAYMIVHVITVPKARLKQFHSYQLWFQDASGNVTYLQGVADFGDASILDPNTGLPVHRAGRRQGGDPSVRPAIFCVDRPDEVGSEQWYGFTTAWGPDMSINFGPPNYLCLLPESADPSTWQLNGGLALQRRFGFTWYDQRARRAGVPLNATFCTDEFGAQVNCFNPGALPQHIASTMPTVNMSVGKSYDCPDCQIPN